ncbi:hypothetical protein WN55_06292 [Dufourea novaeangliae]|uniref:CHK kinase-like domain-containing protein n=2 Tax=Dufourea novaeangliae TaxID=178035 RepID=A0A154PPX1_DUFNO|nr:hypothetical protein WN55_06292 [Dufourea novaeangliae]
MLFVNIIANSTNEDTDKRTVSIVVKKPSQSAALREMMRCDAQFHNEILFYERFAKEHEDLPICYYAEERPPAKTVIVLENIGEREFQLCSWRYNVPMEYTLAAIREIALFHAKGYTMKEHSRAEFFDIVENLSETRYDGNPENMLRHVMNRTSTRSIEYLRNRGHDREFCDRMDAYLGDSYENIVLPICKPEEPLATLCHGDFTLNNTFFKRTNGEVKAMFIDFAMIRYGPPVIDLSTYLCLHCAEELDKDMLDGVLKVYNDTLVGRLAENGVEELERFSYETMREDYRKKGLVGFAIASFFLAIVMGKSEHSPEDMAQISTEEVAIALRELGGDEISEILANMLLKLKDFGCLDHVV